MKIECVKQMPSMIHDKINCDICTSPQFVVGPHLSMFSPEIHVSTVSGITHVRTFNHIYDKFEHTPK